MLAFLQEAIGFDGEYVGYDLAQPAVDLGAQLHPAGRFERRDVLADGVPEDFDYILISGVFNNRTSDSWGLMTQLLEALWPHAKRGLAFNAMSTYVDYQADHLWYADPAEVFGWCKTHAVAGGHAPARLPGQARCDPVRVQRLRVRGPDSPRRAPSP